jgi:hypothetical protein
LIRFIFLVADVTSIALPGFVIRGGNFFLYYQLEALGLCFPTSYPLRYIGFEIKTNFEKPELADDFFLRFCTKKTSGKQM